MLRSSLFTAGVFALCATASAQTNSLTAERMPAPTKYAGVYHVATGTWTRDAAATANFGPDIIYNNSSFSGYFTTAGGAPGSFAGGAFSYDNGAVPTPGGAFATADRTVYTVNGFEIDYCDTNAPAGGGGWDIFFYESHAPCTDAGGAVAADAVVNTAPLPANGFCWLVTIDLMGGGEFCLEGYGGTDAPGWDLNDPNLDSFGWGWNYTGASVTGGAGMVMKGDPENDVAGYPGGAPPAAAPHPTAGNGTYYNPAAGLCGTTSISGVPEETGLLTCDFWFINDVVTPGNSGCYYFGGYFNTTACGSSSNNPFASFHLVLYADAGECSDSIGTFYCPQPNNTTGVPNLLEAFGSDVAVANDVTLRQSNMPGNPGFFFQGDAQAMTPISGTGYVVCVGGPNFGRFYNDTAGNMGVLIKNGPTMEISTTAISSGGALEWSTLAMPNSGGTYAAAAGTSTYFQAFSRDASPPAAFPLALSNAVEIAWN